MDREEYYQLILKQVLAKDFKNVAETFPEDQIHYRNFLNYFGRAYSPSIEELDQLIDEVDDSNLRLHYQEIKLLKNFNELQNKFPKLLKSLVEISQSKQLEEARKKFVEDELFIEVYYFAKEMVKNSPESFFAVTTFAKLLSAVGRPNQAISTLDSIQETFSHNEVIIENLRAKRICIYLHHKRRRDYMKEVSYMNPFMLRLVFRLVYANAAGYLGLYFLYLIGGVILFFNLGESTLFVIYGLLLFYIWQFYTWLMKKGYQLLFDALLKATYLHIIFTACSYALYLLFTFEG